MIKAGELQKLRDAELAKARAILTAAETANEGRGRDLSAEEDTAHQAHMAEVEALNKRMKRAMQMDAWEGTNRSVPPEPVNCPTPQERGVTTVPATPKRWGTLKNFTGPDAADKAYRLSSFIMAIRGHEASREWCRNHGMELRVHKEGIATTGGYHVPEALDNDLIDLREQYGVFRQRARVVPMTSDVTTRRRRVGGLTAYLVGEGAQITESTASWDQITLTARKWGVIATMSSELNEDSAVPLGDILAGEIAYAFAAKEDDAGFNGDGTSTYGGIVGVRSKFTNLTATIADIAGLYLGSGNNYVDLTLADFAGTMGLLPQYADTPNVAWYCSSVMWGHMNRLAVAGGGNTTDMFAGKLSKQFLGYPVVIAQQMPRAEGNSQVCVLFGDLKLAADFGDRRSTTISVSTEASVGGTSVFDTDEIAIRGTERFDINVHDVGNSSATAALRVPGPIVGLITAAS